MDFSPKFVISLDFELMWGIRDHADKLSHGQIILGVREAIPRILDLFAKYDIRATWATVGFLFCENKDELIQSSPALRPTYQNEYLSNYRYFDEVGNNEKEDPFYFGKSLISDIASCDGQDIGTHSFSHYYCLEPGQTIEQFDADIAAAVAIARKQNIELKSFVFPRNQFSEEHLSVLSRRGIRVFRGNEQSRFHGPRVSAGDSPIRRGIRLADQYVNLTGHHTQTPTRVGDLTDVPSSRFLRRPTGSLLAFDSLQLRRIKSSMSTAAERGRTFHVWWHPQDFGINVKKHIVLLEEMLGYFAELRDEFGMTSANMADFA